MINSGEGRSESAGSWTLLTLLLYQSNRIDTERAAQGLLPRQKRARRARVTRVLPQLPPAMPAVHTSSPDRDRTPALTEDVRLSVNPSPSDTHPGYDTEYLDEVQSIVPRLENLVYFHAWKRNGRDDGHGGMSDAFDANEHLFQVMEKLWREATTKRARLAWLKNARRILKECEMYLEQLLALSTRPRGRLLPEDAIYVVNVLGSWRFNLYEMQSAVRRATQGRLLV